MGIENPEQDKIDAATDENGKVDLGSVFAVPPASEHDSKQQTIVKILDEKGYESEEQLYKKEYQLRVAHQLMINGGSTAQIATKLNISPAEARKLKNELSARLINEVKTLDKNKVAGQALMFYDHIMAKSLQLINKTQGDKHLRTQVEALKVALQAQTDKQKFLVMSGFWNNPLDQGMTNYDSHISGANEMREMLSGIVTGNEVEVFLDEDEVPDDIGLL